MSRAGPDVATSPYRGTAPALTDVMGGHVQLLIDASFALIPIATRRQGQDARHHHQGPLAARAGLPDHRRAGLCGLRLPVLVRAVGAEGHAARDLRARQRADARNDARSGDRRAAEQVAARAGGRDHRREQGLHRGRSAEERRAARRRPASRRSECKRRHSPGPASSTAPRKGILISPTLIAFGLGVGVLAAIERPHGARDRADERLGLCGRRADGEPAGLDRAAAAARAGAHRAGDERALHPAQRIAAAALRHAAVLADLSRARDLRRRQLGAHDARDQRASAARTRASCSAAAW